MKRMLQHCGSIVLFVALVTPAQAQQTENVSALPAPTGSFRIGTAVFYLTDATRHRDINVQTWYPTADRRGTTAPYFMEPALKAQLELQQYYGTDSATIEAWSRLRTHALLDAKPAHGRRRLILFSVGQGVIRSQYTSIAEELASHGYIVAIVESPMQGFMVTRGGQLIADTAGAYGDAESHRRGVRDWSLDMSYALDQLERVFSVSDVGAMGHSSGGLVAIATCERDKRVRACVNMDGGLVSPSSEPLADFVPNGVTKPTLFLRSQPLYDDSTFKRRGITRQEWEKRGEADRAAFAAFMSKSKAPVRVEFVPGTGHFSFSDAPFVFPSSISRFGGRIVEPRRGWQIITKSVIAFFHTQLK